jgi:DNA modification methylase
MSNILLEAPIQRRNDYSWDFRGEKTKSYTHCLHAYPAMFIPQVARRLILAYSKHGETIADIFCGSGTTLVESRLLGRNSYGIELNPLAILIAKVKPAPIDCLLLQKVYLSLLDSINRVKLNDNDLPEFTNLDFWFKKQVIYDLAKIKKCINKIEELKIRNFFLVAFSETVRCASNVRKGEFKLFRIPEDKLKDYCPNVQGLFKSKCERNILGMKEFSESVDRKTWVKIIQADSTKEYNVEQGSVDCIITSPPYGDSRTTVAYGQFSRLSLQWLDIFLRNDSNVDKHLMGGLVGLETENELKSKTLTDALEVIEKADSKRAKEVLAFYIDLNKAIIQAHRILRKNGYFCVVIGNRTVKKIKLQTDYIIPELANNLGFKTEDIFVRNIPNKRMPLKNSPTNVSGQLEETMQKESIVILRKAD